jgi:phosphoglycerate dehydrogenase-like enzyme
MTHGAVLVNTSRGWQTDDPELVAALQSSRLAGAGLDLLHDELPLEATALAALHGVMLTPHVAMGSGSERLADVHEVLRNLAEVLRPC